MAKKDKPESAVTVAKVMDTEAALLNCLEKDTKGSASPEAIREQMGSMEPVLERIEVKHAGANLFVFPDGEPVQGDKGFACVILASNFSNARFAHAYDDPEREADERPECKSSDGVTVDPGVESPKAANCSVCPLNCSATAQQARELAFSKDRDERCQNRLSLVVMVPGDSIPYILQLSPRSFKHFASYAQHVGGRSRYLLHEVATQITLKKVGQHAHSEAQFANLGALPEWLRKDNEEAHKSYLAYLRRTATTDRVDDAEATAQAGAAAEASTDPTDAPL
jgi:hypothetical protein